MAKFPMRYPMWQIGQKFELYVYLSSSGDPLNHTNVEEVSTSGVKACHIFECVVSKIKLRIRCSHENM